MADNDKTAFLKSLVCNRNKIQSALLKVYEHFKNTELDPDSKEAQLLVGIGFSLWRAVFLANSTRNWETAGWHQRSGIFGTHNCNQCCRLRYRKKALPLDLWLLPW
jgi:hypothetical protein